MTAEATTPTNLPPCPEWCAWKNDSMHLAGATDSHIDGGFLRNHETAPLGVEPDSFVISNEERVYPDGRVETSAPYVYLHVEYEHLSAGRARDLGLLLQQAALKVEDIMLEEHVLADARA